MDCIFCHLVSGGPKLLWESDTVAAFRDIRPKAPTHVLVVPKKHLTSLAEASPEDAPLLGDLLYGVTQVAAQLGLSENGYRVIINTRAHGGQEVDHLHLHLLGGEPIGPLRVGH